MATPAVPAAEVSAAGAAAIQATPRQRRGQRNIVPYLLLAPSILFLLVFFAWPVVQALILAFQDTTGQWSLAPVERMVNDLRFGESVRNTLLFAAVVIPLQTVLALCMALLLMSNLRGAGAFLYLWAIPLGISDLASGVVWLSIFTDRGYVNSVLNVFGLSESGFPFLSYENPASLF